MVPCRVFIVEDDRLLAGALTTQVEMLGYSVSGTAETAAMAVEGVLHSAPHVVIMDVNLGPGGSGLEAAREIRRHRDVPIVFYTAYGDEPFRRQVADLQNALVLEKPVPEAALEEALSAASDAAQAMS